MNIQQITQYRKQSAAGNVLFLILLAIALLALLTYVVSDSTDQEIALGGVERDSEITRLFSYGASLGGAVQQMVVNGASPAALATSLNAVVPNGAGWDTSPHQHKIFHPYGGGMDYVDSTKDSAGTSALAYNFKVVPGAIVKGVGATDTVGDILFTARVSSAAYCDRINEKLYGSMTAPVVVDAVFTTIFTTGAVDTLDDNTGGGSNSCASCINLSRACVENTSGDAWGYYQVLMPN